MIFRIKQIFNLINPFNHAGYLHLNIHRYLHSNAKTFSSFLTKIKDKSHFSRIWHGQSFIGRLNLLEDWT